MAFFDEAVLAGYPKPGSASHRPFLKKDPNPAMRPSTRSGKIEASGKHRDASGPDVVIFGLSTKGAVMEGHGFDAISRTVAACVTRRQALRRIGAGGLALALLAASGHPVRARQDPSMPPGSTGITPQPLGGGQPSVAPGYAMGLVRLTYAPGGTLNVHTHPGASILYVESGTLTYALVEGAAVATRAPAGSATPNVALPAEQLSPGEIVLNAGDSLFEDVDVIHTARNDGSEPAVVLIANLLTTGEPVTTFLQETPAP